MEYYYEEPMKYEEIDLFEIYEDQPVKEDDADFNTPQPVKVKRISKGSVEKRRPGRLPARADQDLNEVELEQRQRRRERNRHAATRCRSRRIKTVEHLEGQIGELKELKTTLNRKNEMLKAEVAKLRMEMNGQEMTQEPAEKSYNVFDDDRFPALKQLDNLHTGQNCEIPLSLTPIILGKSFDFPAGNNLLKMRNESFSEFMEYLTVM